MASGSTLSHKVSEFLGVVLFAVALISLIALVTYEPSDPTWFFNAGAGGTIDILINNAGAGIYQPSWEMPMDEARYLMELNFFAPLAMTQLVAPHMRARRSGMLVNVGSIGGKVVLPWMTLYSVTKSALGTLTEGQRMELMGDGVRTMLVCPGYVKTGFQNNVRAGQSPKKVQKARRFAITPEQCAEAIRRGVERDARTVVTPRSGWLFVLAMRLFPSIVESRMASINETA